jgi:hypothetical protein
MAVDGYKGKYLPNSDIGCSLEHLEELENTIVFVSTEIELIQSKEGNENEEHVLDVIIGRLLENLNVIKAERICKYIYQIIQI